MKSLLALGLLLVGTTDAFQSASSFLRGARSPVLLSRLRLQADEGSGPSGPDDRVESRRGVLSSLLSAGALSLATAQAANADGSRTIGEITGSGLVFKDILKVEAFDDPKVKGVTLYVACARFSFEESL